MTADLQLYSALHTVKIQGFSDLAPQGKSVHSIVPRGFTITPNNQGGE